MVLAYLATLVSSMMWGLWSHGYASMINKLGVSRFNLYRCIIVFVCFLISSVIIGNVLVSKEAILWLALSGSLVYFLSDLITHHALAKSGPSRILILSAFVPSMVAIYSYFILDKTLSTNKLLGLIFLLLCLFFLALEKKRYGSGSILIFIIAIFGLNIEALGTVFIKKAFMTAPTMDPMAANLYRVLPAIILLLIYNYFRRIPVGTKGLSTKTKATVLSAVFFAGFIGFYLYLYAISHSDNPAVIAALANTAPIFSSIYEHWRNKKLPNKYFIGSILSMIAGLILIL